MDKEFIGKGIPFDPIDIDELDSGKKSSTPQTPAEGAKEKIPEKKGSPIVTVVMAVFMIAALTGSVLLYFLKNDETNRRKTVELNLEKVQSDYKAVDKELRDTLLVKKQLEMDLENGLEKYRKIEGDYKSLQAKNETMSDKFEAKMKVIALLKAKLEREASASTKVSTKLQRVSRDYDDIKGQLSQIRMAKEALEDRIIQITRKNKANSVELEKIVVDSDRPADEGRVAKDQNQPAFIPLGPPAKLEGQILVVNKEFAFVVINIGEKDGIKNLEVLDVYRGQELLGKVQVERIYDTMSSAIILPKVTKQEIKEGDAVKLM